MTMPDPDLEEDDEEAIVVTARVEWMPQPPAPGSEQVACDDCTEPVWISPATKRAIEVGVYPEEPILCVVCAAERSVDDGH